MSHYDLHQYIGALASQLGDMTIPVKANERIAVTSFLLANALESKAASGPGQGLSQQIQESLITYFTQMGYQTTEYRLENAIVLHPSADTILSRDVNKLKTRQNIDYVITGTLTEQQHAYIVNARVTSLVDGLNMSAATIEIPKNVMWTNEKVQMREGTLYRTEY
ncbi:FlgO family outer membrane protein [Pseudoalteromonas xiamenensis]|uniref:FlgO family outer membrane protein n=1 Tax=Pseudoalteromonas xiamenensis TaxID=882626 RepID=UPI0027E556B2|nr:FlgO family outer membrane protein [Pseudoalteromonas xiamenensis]WMN59351.1 FlgO family outer membrane protein [Pseudoalteromonas xiamenensis]